METQVKHTITDLKLLILYCDSHATLDKREVYEFMVKHDLHWQSLRRSLINNYIDISSTINIQSYDEYYYDSDDYVVTREGDITFLDDANFCEYHQEYVTENVVRVYFPRGAEQWVSESIADARYYYCDGDFYSEMEYFNLVYDVDGDICNIDDVYYWDSDGEYHHSPEPDPDETHNYRRDYHDGEHHKITFSDNPKFFVGFEIEKEDEDVLRSIDIKSFEKLCPKWRKEGDGSLDSESGYELVSPTLELNIAEIDKLISNNDTLMQHINAEKSNSCGGHINVSENGLTGQELFDKLKGYNPLFYALYYKRVDINYCKGKSNKDLQEQNEKYQAIRIHGNRIEYRIISAVPNYKTLLWRTKLIEYILNNPTSCVKDAFFKANTSPLKDLILEMYPDDGVDSKFSKLMNRLIHYTIQFENINPKNN